MSASIAALRARLAAASDDARAWLALGTALWMAGEREESRAALARAAALAPADADARNNHGNALTALGDHEAALAEYTAAIAAAPERADLRHNCAIALAALGRTTEALAAYRAAVARDPRHAGAWNNLGNTLRADGQIEAALDAYRQALALRPDFAGTLRNLAQTLIARDRPDEALGLLARALAQRPDDAEVLNLRGGALLALGDNPAALAAFRAARAGVPSHRQARFGEALALLLRGDLRAGFAAYESRWDDPAFTAGETPPPSPLWRGEALAGRTLLLTSEQGLGDSLMMARYAPLLRARGARVVLHVQTPLHDLLAPLADAIARRAAPAPPHDLHCPLRSLPHRLGPALAPLPAASPDLHATPERIAAWAERLGPRKPGQARIGLAWSGSADHPRDALRSIPAARFLPGFATTGAELHAIQRDLRPADAAAAAGLVHLHGAALTDFAETAALIAHLDAVVSVDSAPAHLAAAMGRPTTLLLPFAADWRWMEGRADSPWYPTLRILRQSRPGAWEPVLAAAAATLP